MDDRYIYMDTKWEKATFAIQCLIFLALCTLIGVNSAKADTIYNADGRFESNEFQRAVFVSVFLPDEMDCSQKVVFVTPKAPTEPCVPSGSLVLGPGTIFCDEKKPQPED